MIAERMESPFGSGLKRSASSPPSPVFDLPPIRFMAMASVVCASREIEPNDMAPVEKRRTMVLAGSTSSSGTGLRPSSCADFSRNRPRMVSSRSDCSLLDLGVILVLVRQIAAHRVLERRHRRGGPDVILAAHAELVFAADIERIAVDRRVAEGIAMATHRLLGDLLQPDAFDAGGGAGEILGDEIGAQADGVENLRAAIGLIGGDAHLGHHLEDALVDRLDVALDDLLGSSSFCGSSSLMASSVSKAR